MFQNSVIIIYDIDKKLQYMYGFIYIKYSNFIATSFLNAKLIVS